jgi:hypothetical protein
MREFGEPRDPKARHGVMMSDSRQNLATPAITCPECQRAEFELRIVRDESVAAARCVNCSRHYLLLDSEDYWFDVIQKGYPRATRCSCKSESFQVSVSYSFRDDGDVNYIEVRSTCAACGKSRRQLDFKIDYSPTSHLLERPLVPVSNPKILYDLKDLHLLVTLPEIARVVGFLGEAKCGFVSMALSGREWKLRVDDAAGVNATIESRYTFIYAMPATIDVAEHDVDTRIKEEAFWKRSEVIRIGSKMYACRYGPGEGSARYLRYQGTPPVHPDEEIGISLNIEFSNEFVDGESIVSKSDSFRALTARFIAMLRNEFVSWRGRDSFDNPDVNVRIFGEQFRSRAAKTKRAPSRVD